MVEFTGINKLTLGPNTITQASVDFNRTLKWQFSNNEIEFSSVTLNDAVFWDGRPILIGIVTSTVYQVPF